MAKLKSSKNSLGIRYIHYLILNKKKQIHVYDLYYAINPPDTEITNRVLSEMSAEQVSNEGMSISDLGDAGAVIDEKGIASLKCHLEQLEEQIAEAKEYNEF